MKKSIALILFIVALAATVFSQEIPPRPSTLVSDYTNTLSESQKWQLESKLRRFNDTSSSQIAVVLMQSVGGYDVSDYAVRLAEAWGVGQKGKNNGIVLLAALKDRKVSISTGYGMEGALPDAIARRIIENQIKPNFKSGNYYAGLDQATDKIISYTKGEYKNDAPVRRQGKNKFPFGLIVFILLIILFSSRGGGGNNRGKKVIGSRGASDLLWWTVLANMGRRGGGGGSFGGGGGGFGGFGGGSFGGGGASGSW